MSVISSFTSASVAARQRQCWAVCLAHRMRVLRVFHPTDKSSSSRLAANSISSSSSTVAHECAKFFSGALNARCRSSVGEPSSTFWTSQWGYEAVCTVLLRLWLALAWAPGPRGENGPKKLHYHSSGYHPQFDMQIPGNRNVALSHYPTLSPRPFKNVFAPMATSMDSQKLS